LPPKSISREVQDEIRRHTVALANALNVRGLMNVQFAVQGTRVYVLESEPRASRTVPFVSKAIGVPLGEDRRTHHGWAKTRGRRLRAGNSACAYRRQRSVFPFNKFPGVDTLLGPR
jgi:carbamoyl-phosphate synthase large subunit